MIRLLFFVALLGFGQLTLAKTTEPLEQMISLEQFSSLTQQEKTLYIKNLQALLVTLNEQQSPQSTADNQLFQQLLLPVAFADGEVVNGNVVGGPCIFAGNIMAFAANGLCPRPPSGNCGSGRIQCNPLVFGDGVCVAPNAKATGNCSQSAKPVKEIIRYAESHKEEWQNLSKTLDGYCADTGTQGYPCRVIQTRLSEMQRMVAHADRPNSPPAVAEKPKFEKAAPTAVPLPKPRPTTAPRQEVAGPHDEKPPRPPMPIPNVVKQPVAKLPEVAKKDGPIEGKPAVACDLELLPQIVRCQDDEDLYSLMIYPDAYKNFCAKREFSKEFDDQVRRNFDTTKKCLTKIIETSKDTVVVSNAKFSKLYMENTLMKNYEQCSKDLKNKSLPKIKTIGKMYIETRIAATKNGEKRPQYFAVAQIGSGSREELGNMFFLSNKLKAKKYGMCDLTPVLPASSKDGSAPQKNAQ